MLSQLSLLLTGADPSLGKVDKASLSDFSLLELFSEGIINFSEKILSNGEISDISQWKGVHLNENGDVDKIIWGFNKLQGTIALEWIPLNVWRVFLWTNRLSGSLNLTSLPEVLRTLDLGANKFNGSVDLTKLPNRLENLVLCDNELSGALDLTSLPSHATAILLNKNTFSGETDFTKIPETLRILNVSNTNLSGEIVQGPGFIVFNENSDVIKLC